MEITEAQYRLIEHCLPTQRGNVSLSNLRVTFTNRQGREVLASSVATALRRYERRGLV